MSRPTIKDLAQEAGVSVSTVNRVINNAEAVRGLRIVVCEDDTFIRLDMVEMLEAAGAEVREAATGAEALALLAQAPAQRLLIDVGLPDRSGLEVAREAAARQPDLPVIFATGRDSVPGAEALPGARVLTKPFGQEALLRIVGQTHAPARP